MNISRLYILPVDSTEARVYEWDTNHLTFEELIAFIASRDKMPDMTKWITNETNKTPEV